MKILISDMGQVAAFDEKGQQIAELQKALPILIAEQAEKLGIDPTKFAIEFVSSGRTGRITKSDFGYNWEYK